jgi:DNA-directed RNA polymerase sigma subunit (sigma70/sigma32)
LGLTIRERYVLEERAKGKTLEEIGYALGSVKERIRQIEALARWKSAP